MLANFGFFALLTAFAAALYATVMALMVDPEEAYKNMRVLSEQGFEGKYGFYEAIDYTPSRLPRGQSFAVIRSFMVHHQGMSFLSLVHLLLHQPMQRRFQAEVQFKAAELLLQERVPKTADGYMQNATDDINVISSSEPEMRVINSPHTPAPEVQLLSNGRYSVSLRANGAGWSRWRSTGITRWRDDALRDAYGSFFYVRWDPQLSPVSITQHPAPDPAAHYNSTYHADRVCFDAAQGFVETPLYDRDDLAPGTTIRGPAIVEEFGSTVPVHPGFEVRVDEYLNLIVTRSGS